VTELQIRQAASTQHAQLLSGRLRALAGETGAAAEVKSLQGGMLARAQAEVAGLVVQRAELAQQLRAADEVASERGRAAESRLRAAAREVERVCLSAARQDVRLAGLGARAAAAERGQDELAAALEVRKTPSWPRSWTNSRRL
jgi:hypothetical protein